MRWRHLYRVQEGTISASRDPRLLPPRAFIALVTAEVDEKLEGFVELDDEYDDDEDEDEPAEPREVVETYAAPSAGPYPLRLGDEGALVVKVTRRLSYVHGKTTGRPYLDGARKRLDADAVAAVRAFQTDHGLEPDGVVGPTTARELHRAALSERLRRKKEGEQPEDLTPEGFAEVTEVLARMERTLDLLVQTTVAERRGNVPPEPA